MPKDGDCMFHTARACLAIEEDTVLDKMYIGRNVQHQAIVHFLEYRDILFEEVERGIKEEYGRVDSELVLSVFRNIYTGWPSQGSMVVCSW